MMKLFTNTSNREQQNNVNIMGLLPENTKFYADSAVHITAKDILLENRAIKR